MLLKTPNGTWKRISELVKKIIVFQEEREKLEKWADDKIMGPNKPLATQKTAFV
jgi:hypothetical protein